MLRLQLKHTYANDLDVLSRLYLAYTGTAPTSANLNTMATTVGTAWGTNLKALAPNEITLTEVIITDLTTTSSGVGVAATSVVGTRGTAYIAAGSALLFNFLVDRRYRGGKPRMYAPFGISTDLSTAQLWSSTFRTACVTGLTNFRTAVIAAAPSGTTITAQVNVSYYLGFTSVQNPVTLRWKNIPTARTTPVVDTVTGIQANPSPASQRRRNRSGL